MIALRRRAERNERADAESGVSDGARMRTVRAVRRGEILTGVLIAIVGGLLLTAYLDSANDRQGVLVVKHDIAEGTTLTEADLGIEKIAVDRMCPRREPRSDDCVDLIPAEELEALVGRPAAVALRPGTLLASSQVAQAEAPKADEVIVAVPVPRDRLPTGIEVGDRVRILDTGGGGREGSEPSVLIQEARVFALAEPSRSSDSTVVSVVVVADDAPAVTAAVAADRIGLVLITAR